MEVRAVPARDARLDEAFVRRKRLVPLAQNGVRPLGRLDLSFVGLFRKIRFLCGTGVDEQEAGTDQKQATRRENDFVENRFMVLEYQESAKVVL